MNTVTSYCGKDAYMFSNRPVTHADDIVRTGLVLPEGDFTLSFWIRTEKGGARNMTRDKYPALEKVDFSLFKSEQLFHVSTLLTNAPFPRQPEKGFLIAMLPSFAYMVVQLTFDTQEEPVQISGVRAPADGRWHKVTLSVCRKGDMTVWTDGEKTATADISSRQGYTLGEQALVMGADVNGCYGADGCVLCDLKLNPVLLTDEEILADYYTDAVAALRQEIRTRGLETSPLYESTEVQAFLDREEKLASGDRTSEEKYGLMRKEYEDFLLRTVKPDVSFLLCSDVHHDDSAHGRTGAYEKALKKANEIGAQAICDSGDYTNMGLDNEFAAYWNMIDRYWQGKALFQCIGNHETLERPAEELVSLHCGHLARQGMVKNGYGKFYYDGVVNGIPFIVLAQYSERYTVTGKGRMWRFAGEIWQDQVDFLHKCLEKNCGKGKPVFLFIHNAVENDIRCRIGNCYGMDSVLIEGEKLLEELKNHPDVVVCTGHVHHGLGVTGYNYLPEDGYGVLDIPGFRSGSEGYGIHSLDAPGTRHGVYYAFVFGKTVLLRAYDAAREEWLTAYDETFTIPEK